MGNTTIGQTVRRVGNGKPPDVITPPPANMDYYQAAAYVEHLSDEEAERYGGRVAALRWVLHNQNDPVLQTRTKSKVTATPEQLTGIQISQLNPGSAPKAPTVGYKKSRKRNRIHEQIMKPVQSRYNRRLDGTKDPDVDTNRWLNKGRDAEDVRITEPATKSDTIGMLLQKAMEKAGLE